MSAVLDMSSRMGRSGKPIRTGRGMIELADAPRATTKFVSPRVGYARNGFSGVARKLIHGKGVL